MQFRALTDLYLNDGRYISAGQVFDAPVNLDQTGWQYVINFTPPVNAVDPVSPDAVQAYHDAGCAGCADAEWRRALFTNTQRWSDIPVTAPSTQWVPVNPKKPGLGFILSGAGSNLGPKLP
jgi:hypothetical protein